MLLSKIVATNAKHYYTKSFNTKKQRNQDKIVSLLMYSPSFCLLWFLKRQWTFNIYCAHAQWVLRVVVAFELFQSKPWAHPIFGRPSFYPGIFSQTQMIHTAHQDKQPSNYLCDNTSTYWTSTIHMNLNSDSRCKNFPSVVCHACQRIFLSSHAPSCAPLTSGSILRYGWSTLAGSEGEHRTFTSKSVYQICS